MWKSWLKCLTFCLLLYGCAGSAPTEEVDETTWEYVETLIVTDGRQHPKTHDRTVTTWPGLDHHGCHELQEAAQDAWYSEFYKENLAPFEPYVVGRRYCYANEYSDLCDLFNIYVYEPGENFGWKAHVTMITNCIEEK